MTVVVGLERGWRSEARAGFDLAVEATVVEPVDIGESLELDIIDAALRALRVDQLPLVEPVEGLGHGIVEAVALRAHRRADLVLGERLRVAHAEILPAFNRSL